MRRQVKRMDCQKRKPFHIVTKNGKAAVVRRRTKKRIPLQTLAVLQGSATINEHWDFLGPCRASSRRASHSTSIARWSMQRRDRESMSEPTPIPEREG
ncbi:hypothetical protein AOQ72_12085 [Bradyrhizobium yuanmingense]|uniref:Uncharacterized protein n=1 Tax=Bradyrhizobium yuanmingense TaxID=108015 RepID=A0A0R3CXD9_9BRAD|nr:hypothetical protein AOQ72_12085 [Bradyrhizobium yuanmingense]